LALEITDFQQSTNLLTLDAVREALPKGGGVNDRSASMLAASQSLLTEPTQAQYTTAKAELMDPASREQFILREQMIRDEIFKDAQTSLFSTLGDTTATDTNKVQAYLGSQAITTSTLPPMSSLDIVAQEAIIADSDGETAEGSAGRSLLLDTITRVNESKRELTAMISSLEIAQDAGAVAKIADVAETIVPLVEWNHIDRLLREALEGGDTEQAILLGNQKRQLFEVIQRIPVEQRAAFAEQIIALVQDHDTVLLPDGNDLMTLETLERMLVDNDYSNFERWFDNATSILDVVGVGAAARTLFRGTKAVARVGPATRAIGAGATESVEEGATLAREASEFVSEAPPTNSALETEARSFTPEQQPTSPRLTAEAEEFANTPQSLGAVGERLQDEALVFQLDQAITEAESSRSLLAQEALAYSTRTNVVPASPSQVIKDVNPEMARAMHTVVSDDTTGEAAKALYGTSREEALAKDLLPEPEIRVGSVPNKVEMPSPVFAESEAVRAARRTNGNTAISAEEFSRVTTKLTEGFRNVEGMVLHPSSLVVRTNLDGTVGFTARYSPPNGGFSSPARAIEQAKIAFRNYGITDENLTLLARRGDEFVETTESDLIAETTLRNAGANVKLVPTSEYAVGLKYDYSFRPEDLDEVELLTTAPGLIARGVQFLDRVPTQVLARLGQGSLVQNLLDAASVIHPRIVNAASVAVDRTFGLKKLYVDEFQGFTDTYKSLPAERRALMTDYIQQANLEGVPFNVTDLYARGFSEKEIEALKVWRRANDTMWYASNEDMVQTLRAQGVKVFTDSSGDTKLMGRSVARGAIGDRSSIYDPVENGLTSFGKTDLDEIYEQGGEVVRLLEPLEVDGRLVDLVVSRNSVGGGYTRAIADGEKVLAYRDGYYPVMYDANFFITKRVKGADGEEFTRVVAAARSRKEVNQLLKSLGDSEGLSPEELASTYSFRKDRRLESPSNSLFDEGSWNVASNSGLTSQRFRGQRLQDAGSDLHKIGNAHLKDPLEAVANQIQQLSQRVSMRTYMETVKKRWLLNYGKYLDLPKDKFTGGPSLPTSISDVKGKSGIPAKIIADARTNYNYISGLENGYINGIDSLYRATIHAAADFAGELGITRAETALFEAVKVSPIQAAKTAAFKLFISGNPVRQAIIQRGQMLQIGAINPSYFAKSMVPDLLGIDAVRIGVSTNPKYVALFEEVKTAGILEAVDAHTLIRQDTLRLADMTVGQKVRGALSVPLDFAQKIGFDAAEQDVLLSAWLAQRDLAIKAGRNISDQRVKDEILGEARAFTLNMNRSGEMPYSQNTLGLVAQFFSFRHKAFLQPFTNRSLTVKQRAKLLAYTTALFGLDATMVGVAANMIMGDTEPSPLKDKLSDGLLDTTLNATLSTLSGEDQMIDWGDLAPVEAYGMGNVFVAMLDTPLSEMLTASPAGSLLFGANPRVNDAFKTGLRYFNVIDDYEDPELATRFTDVVVSSVGLFSGFSNVFKARYAYQTGTKMSGSGRITDADVSGVEAAMAAFGFQTKTETGYRMATEELYGGGNFTDDDVTMWYRELKRHLAKRGETVAEADMAQRVLSEAWRVFGEDRPRAVEALIQNIQRDATDGDHTMIKALIGKMGFMTNDELWKVINSLPAGPVRDSASEMLRAREEMLNGG
jgi:hypothetical protein